jgi:hypothetical protein
METLCMKVVIEKYLERDLYDWSTCHIYVKEGFLEAAAVTYHDHNDVPQETHCIVLLLLWY